MKSARKSLQQKLITRYFILALCLLLIVFTAGYFLLSAQILRDSGSQVLQNAKQADSMITRFFSAHLTALIDVSQTNPVKEMSVQDANTQIQTLLRQDNIISSVALVSREGKQVFLVAKTGTDYTDTSYTDDPLFKVPMYLGGSIYFDNKIVSENGKHILTVSVPVIRYGVPPDLTRTSTSAMGAVRKNGEISGVLIAQVLADPLLNELKNLKNGKTGHILLVSRDGTLIYNPNGSSADAGAINELLKSGDNSFTEWSNEDHLPALGAAVSNELTGWKIISEITKADALSVVTGAGLFAVIVFFALLIFAVLLGLVFTDTTLCHLRELFRQLRGLINAPRTSRLTLTANDESADLADTVNQIIDRLDHRIQDSLQQIQKEQTHFNEEQKLLVTEQAVNYEEKEKLDYVLSKISDGVILLSRNRQIVLLNKAAEEITGFGMQEAQHKPIGQIMKLYEQDREIFMDEYAPVTKTDNARGEAYLKKRVRLENPRATTKLIDLICVRLILIHTQDLEYMVILRNLTEEIEAEKKQMGLLASFASELKQPVNMVSNYFSLFSQQHEGILQDANMYLGKVQSGIFRLSLIMDNLLTAAAVENNTLTLNPEAVDLSQTVKQLLAIIYPLALEKTITLQFNEPKDFATVVTTDSRKTQQVIMNLLFNALNFTPLGGSITIFLMQSGSEIILQIQDTGIGIPQEAMKDLFTKFYTVQNTLGMDLGIGLGLYVCKSLMQLQNGKVWIDSVEGRGTVASLSLPKA